MYVDGASGYFADRLYFVGGYGGRTDWQNNDRAKGKAFSVDEKHCIWQGSERHKYVA